MKTSIASEMCTLSCALIICTLVSTARTTNTNTDDSNEKTLEPFDRWETTTEEPYDDWIELPSTTPIANGKYGSKPSLSTPPVPDLNDSPYPDEFVTDNSIDSSTKLGNDYIPSDKKNSYTTEPIPTTNGTQLLAEPPTRFLSTSRTANTNAVVPNIPTYIPGGEKAKKIVADPIVDIAVRLIWPHVKHFHNIHEDNYEEIRSNNTTNTNVYEDIIVNHVVLSPEAINNDFEKDDILLQNNWSQYKPAMMKTQISVVLHQPPQTSLPIPSTSEIPPYAYMSKNVQRTAATIPPKAVEGKKSVSQRRPVMTTILALEKCLEAKKLSLEASRDAGEEPKLLMKILRLRVQQEVEKLKQENIKTNLLKFQIQRESGTEWAFEDNNEADKTD